MEITDFRKQVAGFMNRTEASFVVNGYDLLARAVLKARMWAQRRHNFEFARMSVSLPSVSLAEGGLLSTAVNTQDVTEPVLVKIIERAFLPFQDDSAAFFPIEIISRAAHMTRLKRRFSDAVTTRAYEATGTTVPAQFAMVQQGERVYLIPPGGGAYGYGTSAVNLRLDVVRFMPDYSFGNIDEDDDVLTDFFLEYCEDFMLLRSLVELNFFLKEDQRVPISAQAMEDSWKSVLAWDTSLVSGTSDDITLD